VSSSQQTLTICALCIDFLYLLRTMGVFAKKGGVPMWQNALKQRKIFGVLFLCLMTYESQAASPTCSVVASQATLKQLGYDPGPIDGIWGQKMATAVARYQADQRLSVTRILDESTCLDLKNVRSTRNIDVSQNTKGTKDCLWFCTASSGCPLHLPNLGTFLLKGEIETEGGKHPGGKGWVRRCK